MTRQKYIQSKFIIFELEIQLILSLGSTYGILSSFPGSVLILFLKNEHIEEKDQICPKKKTEQKQKNCKTMLLVQKLPSDCYVLE